MNISTIIVNGPRKLQRLFFYYLERLKQKDVEYHVTCDFRFCVSHDCHMTAVCQFPVSRLCVHLSCSGYTGSHFSFQPRVHTDPRPLPWRIRPFSPCCRCLCPERPPDSSSPRRSHVTSAPPGGTTSGSGEFARFESRGHRGSDPRHDPSSTGQKQVVVFSDQY